MPGERFRDKLIGVESSLQTPFSLATAVTVFMPSCLDSFICNRNEENPTFAGVVWMRWAHTQGQALGLLAQRRAEGR